MGHSRCHSAAQAPEMAHRAGEGNTQGAGPDPCRRHLSPAQAPLPSAPSLLLPGDLESRRPGDSDSAQSPSQQRARSADGPDSSPAASRLAGAAGQKWHAHPPPCLPRRAAHAGIRVASARRRAAGPPSRSTAGPLAQARAVPRRLRRHEQQTARPGQGRRGGRRPAPGASTVRIGLTPSPRPSARASRSARAGRRQTTRPVRARRRATRGLRLAAARGVAGPGGPAAARGACAAGPGRRG